MVHINLTNARRRDSADFSLRFYGQEVAKMVVNTNHEGNLEVQLNVDETHASWNSKYFGWKDKLFSSQG